MIEGILDSIGNRIRETVAEWLNVDWFWLDFSGYALVVLAIIVVLAILSRFLPESTKPIALGIVTLGLGFLWGYWKRRQDELKRKKVVVQPPKPKPPQPPTWPPFGR